jgi:hypothetical protein
MDDKQPGSGNQEDKVSLLDDLEMYPASGTRNIAADFS